MKIKQLIRILFLALIIQISMSCEDYLDRPPEAVIMDEDVFSTYYRFQGFVDGIYQYMMHYLGKDQICTVDMGDDVYSNNSRQASSFVPEGRYERVWAVDVGNPFLKSNGRVQSPAYAWWEGWEAIHLVNLGFNNFDLLKTATQEERNLLLGQLHFFRAWFHFEIARSWGGIPYVDVLLQPDDNLKLERLSLEETFLKIAEDFNKAIGYLPWNWNTTAQGQLAPGIHTGRVAKGAAYAMKARTFIYAASPWIKGLETQTWDYQQYNLAYCDSAAKAALQVMQSSEFELTPWNDYLYNFCSNDNDGGNLVWTKEIVWNKVRPGWGRNELANVSTGRVHVSRRTILGSGGNGIVTCPTWNFVKLYETVNGLNIEDDPAYDPNLPWANRDPRLFATIHVDGVLWSTKGMRIELFSEGGPSGNGAGLDMIPNAGGSRSGFLIRKYVPWGCNGDDKDWNSYRLNVPYVRLPEIYLTYAEAVNEISGPGGSVAGGPTAIEAVNTVRRRIKLEDTEDITLPFELKTFGVTSFPDVNSMYTSSKEVFREKIRNERSVELSFEGHRWFDIRRWYVAHLPEYKTSHMLLFSKDYTSFREEVMLNRVFDYPKHYFVPFRRSDVNLYDGFIQNPGWE